MPAPRHLPLGPTFFCCALTLLALATPGQAAAASPIGELTGGRAQAMGGAHRGDGRDNETLLLNPAGMALSPRYGIDLNYGYFGGRSLNELAVSVVDSKSSRLAAGMRATRAWGNASGLDLGLYRLAFGSALAITESLAIGAVAKNHRGHWRPGDGEAGEDLSLWTGSVGLMVRALGRLTVGAVWENVIGQKAVDQILMRPGVAFGAGLALGRLSLAADGRIDLRDGASRVPDLAAGIEVLPVVGIACRAGFLTDQAELGLPRRQALSGGLALFSPTAGFHLGATRDINGSQAWSLFTGLKLAV